MMEDGFDQAKIDAAVRVAADAEIALLFIGLPPFKESEGYDRPDMDLSDQQVALIQAVSAVQPRCVVILNSGSPVAMSAWIDGVPAVLEAWLMGQAGGGAIADVLFGKVNPSGRLAETFPLKLSDTPAYLNFPGGNGVVRYGEGLFIGYRYYDAKQVDVLFPFGYGLSYTTFEVNNLRLSQAAISDTDDLTVTVDVTNTGAVAGKTVVQVYVHDRESDLVAPGQGIEGFRQSRAGTRPDENGPRDAGAARLRVLSSRLRAVGDGKRRVRHPGRAVVRRPAAERRRYGDLGADACAPPAPLQHAARMARRCARGSGIGAADAGHHGAAFA